MAACLELAAQPCTGGLRPADKTTLAFMAQAGDRAQAMQQFYPAPVAFELKDFNQVQASVFQVARALDVTLCTWAARC